MERKKFLKITGSAAALAFFGGITSLLESCKRASMDMSSAISVITGKFDNILRLPPIINGTSPINLVAKRNTASIIKGKTSYVLGYGDSILAPIIKVNNGQNVSINFQNQLEEITNIHWHGLIIPENMDGHPRYLVQPNSTFNYQFSINQQAGTNWFHPHPHLKTGRQVFRGLAGMFIVNDSEEAALNLPSGEFELPVIIQDKRIYADGSINYSPEEMDVMSGYFGQYICVNGSWSAYHNVKTKVYRLRILNGSNARVYNLSFSNGIPFNIIGSDSGLLGSTQIIGNVILSPGERIDVLVDFSSLSVGAEFYLQSNTFNGGDSQGSESFKIMKFNVTEQVPETFSIPSSLVAFVPISPSLSIKTRTFDISNIHMAMPENGNMNMGMNMDMSKMHNIGGKSFDMERIDETVSANTTEIWEFDNAAGEDLHPMHLHGVQFQVISRTGGRGVILPHEMGWKDTVLCMPGEKVKIIMTFPNNLGTFAFHCHNLEHEDSGMMLNFKIV
jgi:FtsP/CotA-like multicopper oxidase with cupredoxin domain